MKKTSWLFILLSIFCLVMFNNNGGEVVKATTPSSTVQFEISNGTSGKIKVNGNAPVVSEEYSKFSDVLELVTSSLSENTIIYLNFVDFDLDKTTENSLIFNHGNIFVLSGKISSTKGFAGIVISGNTSTNLSLQNLTLNISNTVNIIEFETANHNLEILDNVNYSNSNLQGMPYLFEYKKDNKVKLDENNQTKIKIYVSNYDIIDERVLYCDSNSFDNVEIYKPLESGFKLQQYYNFDDKAIVINTFVIYNFELNGGSFESIKFSEYTINGNGDYTVYYPYYFSTSEINFNDQGVLTKDYSKFIGWFGKVKIDNQDYYFDLEMLKNYVENGKDFSKISTYFTTDMKDLKAEKSIISYIPRDKTNIEKYCHTEIFLENGLVPTFIAKWENNKYTISFETNINEEIDDILISYGEDIPEFKTISKEGYILEGWYFDSNFENKFTETKMLGYDFKLYAKWEVGSFVINFETNGGSAVESETYEFNSQIVEPEKPTKAGYKFSGWYSDEGLKNRFVFNKMGASDITLYAKWIEELYSIRIYSNVSSKIHTESNIPYNSNMPNFEVVPETGYNFVGWFTNTSYNEEVDLTQKVVSNMIIYAYYTPNQYTITFVSNCNVTVKSITQIYKTKLEIPEIKNTGFKFAGWYKEENFVNKFNESTMPAENVTLYAKWIEKETININLNAQSYVHKEVYAYFHGLENVSGIKIHYLVGENWEINPPQVIGEYDVRITREEDEKYKAIDVIIQKGLKVLTPETNVTWIIVFFYLATLVEIAVSMFVRMMRKKKLSTTYVFIGSIFIRTSQFVHLIISGLLFLSGFVYMIYQIVQVNRTVNNENFAPSKQDNRERFKDALAFQNDKNNAELDFEIKTKTDESFGDKYSESDIERMLEGDTYRDELNKTREKFGGLVDTSLEEDDYNYSNYDWDDDYNEDLVHENVMPNRLRQTADEDETFNEDDVNEKYNDEEDEKINLDNDDGI